MEDLVPLDRVKVRDFSGSLYILIPRAIREQQVITANDEIQYSKDVKTGRLVIEKVTSEAK